MAASKPLVFFGSGPVARDTLVSLSGAGLNFEAIITKPRVAGYRGSVPVLEFATERGIPYYTPTTKEELSGLFAQHKFNADTGLVVDYGIIVAKDVIDAFPKGILNSHFSLLPEWRGADPITFSILSGQEVTGVSIMIINDKLDEGELLAQESLIIPHGITTPELTNELVALSAKMLTEIIPKYQNDELKPFPQPTDREATYSRKLTKEDGWMDRGKPADQLEREVRAYAGWPKSKTNLFGKYEVVVKRTRVAQGEQDGALVIPTGQGTFLEILELTAPSGKSISGADFLRGYNR